MGFEEEALPLEAGAVWGKRATFCSWDSLSAGTASLRERERIVLRHHSPAVGMAATSCRSVYKASILRPEMAFLSMVQRVLTWACLGCVYKRKVFGSADYDVGENASSF